MRSLLAEHDVAVRYDLVAELVVSLVDFVVGERAVHSLVGEAVNHVLLAGFDLVAFVDALERDLREVLRVEALDAGEDVFVSHRLGDFDGNVAGRRNLAAEGLEHNLLVAFVFHLVHVGFHHVRFVTDFVSLEAVRVEFAHRAKYRAVADDFGLLARVEEEFRLLRGAEFDNEAEALEEVLDKALEGGKVNLLRLVVQRIGIKVAGDGEGDEVGFVKARIAFVLASTLELSLGNFEQTNRTRTVLFVFGNSLEQVGEERCRDGAEFFAERVQQKCRLAATVVACFAKEGFGASLAREAEAQAFVEAHGRKRLADFSVQNFNRRKFVRLHRELRQAVRNVVEADEACNFFDEVDFAFEVRAEARDLEREGFSVLLHDFECDTREELFDLFGGNFHADDLGGAGNAERHLVAFLLVVVAGVFDRPLEDAASSDFLDEGAGVLAVFVLRGEVDFAFEAVAGIRRDAEALGLLADNGRIEPCTFEEHVLGGIDDFGFDTAHDASDASRTVTIADHEVIFDEFVCGVVDGFNRFALDGAANLDLVAVELVHVKAVERLTDVHQDEVRDIDDVVDAVHADCVQKLGEPCRGLFDLHVLDDAAYIAGATATRNDFEAHGGACCFGIFLEFVGERLERAAKLGGKFTGDTAVAECIRTVRRDVQFKADVVEAEAHERRACRDGIIENHDAGVVVRKTDFVFGANHAEAFDTADLGLLHLELGAVGEREFCTDRGENDRLACCNVRGAANDLNGVRAVVDRGDVQVVAIRVRVAGEDLGDEQLVVDLARFFHAFDFETDGGECLCNIFRRFRKINMASKPIQRNFHFYTLCGTAFAKSRLILRKTCACLNFRRKCRKY